MRTRQVNYGDEVMWMYPEFITDKVVDNNQHCVRSFTFQVTDACNLACSYCYQINKGHRRMSLDTAKLAVDRLLTGEGGFDQYFPLDTTKGIVLEFIGGEPFLEVDLIDQIVSYFRKKAIMMHHTFAKHFRLSICTNGVLYNTPQVQKFIQKYADILSLSVTVDGTKELHDACRCFPDGSPSYDLAHAAALDWMSRGNYLGSKITLAPGNLTYFKDSLLSMVKDGYHDINCNCVYEEGWQLEHATELFRQIKAFVDEFVPNYNVADYYISMFDEIHGIPQSEKNNNNWCGGTGLMLAMDPDGYLYPCLRYMESSIGNDQPPMRIGNVFDGMMQTECDKNCVKCLNAITRRSQSTDQCFYCPISSGCGWCSAYNYQIYGTANKRATFICEMHKARILGTCYYWNHYHKLKNDGNVYNLWVPEKWGYAIIGKEEYDKLAELTESLGGYVNREATMLKLDSEEDSIERIIKNKSWTVLQ